MIIERIKNSIEVKNKIINSPVLLAAIEKTTTTLTDAFKNGNKVLFCGNGGSAADAQHLTTELSGRFYFDRPPLPAEACHVNSSFAFKTAKEVGMICICFTGETGGKLNQISDVVLNVPSNDTPRIQESHITIGHIICEWVEKTLFGNV